MLPPTTCLNHLGHMFINCHRRKETLIHCMYSLQQQIKYANWYEQGTEELVNHYMESHLYSLNDVALGDELIANTCCHMKCQMRILLDLHIKQRIRIRATSKHTYFVTTQSTRSSKRQSKDIQNIQNIHKRIKSATKPLPKAKSDHK